MSEGLRVQVKRDIWNWAINEGQLDKNDLTSRYPRIEKWIEGIESPTFKQLENFAGYAKVPFGYMFLKTPPIKNVMEIEYRSINNKLPKMSKNLKDTIFEMDNRREWMRSFRKNLGWDKISILDEFASNKTEDIQDIAIRIKKLFKIEFNWYEKVNDYETAFKFLREKMEKLGVLIMQNGIVGMNTHRPLDINEFRAFLLYDEIAPVIFINSKDTMSGKIFSLVHECIHFLFQNDDIFINADDNQFIENERFINNITAEFMIPKDQINNIWSKEANKIKQINDISKLFKVSRLALAIKLRNLFLISDEVLNEVIKTTQKDLESRAESSGGDFYRTYFTRNSPTFTKAVIRSAETQEISYTYAFKLLGGIKGKTYDNIKEEILRYG